MANQDIQFDVAVIGAGPAGMMAAVQAAKNGARVALIEKKDRAGIKLLMTGNGRCNLTQAEFDVNELVKKYGKNGRFLYAAFSQFGPKQVIDFFGHEKLKTKIEKGGKVFPKSDQGKDVLNVFIKLLKENNVNFFYESDIQDFIIEDNKIVAVKMRKRTVCAEKYIIAVGGKSYPNTGSTGDGYAWAKKFGHEIIQPQPVLVPINTEPVYEELQGVSIHNCEISLIQNNKKIAKVNGDMIFTHFGISGPAVLNISRDARKALEKGEVKISIDFKPFLSETQLDEILRNDLEKNASKNFSNCLEDILSPKLREFVLAHSGINLEKHAANISKTERMKLMSTLKGFEFEIESLMGFEKAMVTRGGIATKEVDSKTMQSRIIENLYFAGEILDVDGPTGGYNLQMCWATGYVAGKAAFGRIRA
jgi:predicted Rossmann fold flavoprotein